jgi:hypothetical protein
MEIGISSMVVAARDRLSSELGGEAVILDLDGGIYYGLNEVGTRIWSLVQEPASVVAVCAQLQEEYEVESDRCEAAVLRFLWTMASFGLIEIRPGR